MLGNLVVALGVTALQVVVLIVCALARGIEFNASATGTVWFVAAATLFAIGMYGVAETLAARVPRQEEYIGRVPAIAIAPWFLAGSLFPISAMPQGLADFAKVLPLTHGLALMRYGLLGDSQRPAQHLGHDERHRDGDSEPRRVVTIFAAALTAVSIRVFTRSSVR